MGHGTGTEGNPVLEGNALLLSISIRGKINASDGDLSLRSWPASNTNPQ